jgi:hypothetical protein
MKKFIVTQNIDRYRRLLANEANAAKRAVLERLLAEDLEIWNGIDDAFEDDGSDKQPKKQEPSEPS